ncbi:AMP-binding enzyme [Actinomyces israelii]|uniref:AMP-binding enzyme n=1 Tax=Actinomyces israelii TaxID=1659 RepID=UPI00385757A4
MRAVCDPGAVSAHVTPPPPPAPRPLRLVVGGTGAHRIAHLHGALADVLHGRPAGPGPTAARGGRGPAGAAGGPRPLIVPIGPREDAAVVRADLAGRIAGVPERADIILRTSGSTTGTARLVAMGAAALVASARATHARLGGPGTWVLALPAHHVAGLQVLVRSVVAGTRPVVVDTAGGFDAGALAAGAERALGRGGPVYVSLVPTQLLRVLADPGAAAVLARASAVLVGGAATDPALLARSRAAGIRAVTTYGMSETGGGCVYDGLPLEGVSVRIEDPDEAGVGRIVLAGPVLAEGYVGPPGAPSRTAQTGRPAESARSAEPTRSAAFRTGPRELATADRGRLEALPDGSTRLTVLGRLDDIIVTGGIKVDPHEVEQVLAGLPGVAQACVVGIPDATWGSAVVAVVVPEAGAAVDGEGLRRQARERLDGAHAPKRVLVVPEMPLRGPGKTDRRAVAALCRAMRGLPRPSEAVAARS